MSVSIRELREYIEAYGIQRQMPYLEKSELIKTILETEITEYHEQVRNHIKKAGVKPLGVSTEYTGIPRLVQTTRKGRCRARHSLSSISGIYFQVDKSHGEIWYWKSEHEWSIATRGT